MEDENVDNKVGSVDQKAGEITYELPVDDEKEKDSLKHDSYIMD